MSVRAWWDALPVARKRTAGAVALGLLGIGVWAVALRRRPTEIATTVEGAIDQLGGDPNPNAVADLAYWSLYPTCPKWLDPKDPSHADCIELWLEVRNEARFQLGCLRERPAVEVYPPGSQRQIDLFRRAAQIAGVPESWADSKDLRYILAHESAGIVGVPNYTYGWRGKEAACWPAIHDQIRHKQSTTASNATGLGQLLGGNAEKYYPSGRAGIGDPLEEAVGMLLYIEDRYGTPAAARACYGKAPCEIPGKGTKTFREGY